MKAKHASPSAPGRDAAAIDDAARARARQVELHALLTQTEAQLLQSERMASVGQLAAGVAHEINNPIGYVQSNLGSLETYVGDLMVIIGAYEAAEALLPANHPDVAKLVSVKADRELDFLKNEIRALLDETREGVTRVRKIVQDLKDFSRIEQEQTWEWADLHDGLDRTLNIVANELKYRATVVKRYGALPLVQCLPSQLNQVFLNLLVNAGHAISEPKGTITITTGVDEDTVWIDVCDTGCGIPQAIRARIFEPFFTTKKIGQGTGLGLAMSYGIVQKHQGRIDVKSRVGAGSTFRVVIPVCQEGLQTLEGGEA